MAAKTSSPSHHAEVEPEAAEPINHAALAPDQLLQPNETIILAIKPSGWYVLLGSLRELVYVAAVLVTTVMLDRVNLLPVARRDVFLILIAATILILFWRLLDWTARTYILTDRRVMRIQGVFRVQVFETQLKRIQHTHTLFSVRERLFALGTIGFATAGTGGVEAYWLMIANPLDVHRQVVSAINRYR